MDAVVEQRDERVERVDADAREPFRQHVRTQRHRRPHGADRKRLAQPGRVAAQQVELQRVERLGRDFHVREGAEAGVDAVGRLVAACPPIDDGARRAHAIASRFRQRDRLAAVRDGEQLFDSERGTVKKNHGRWSFVVGPSRILLRL